MKKLLFILLFVPLLSFSQFDWKKGWNGNVEVGTSLESVIDLKYDRFMSRGFIGGRVYHDSILGGRLLVRTGFYLENRYGQFFLNQEKHNNHYHYIASIHYNIFPNKYVSPVVGIGYMRHKEVSYAPGWYDYLQIDGIEVSGELWVLPKSRISIGIELGIGFGRSIEYTYYRAFRKGTLFTLSKPILFTLQYKLFQKEKVVFNKKNE